MLARFPAPGARRFSGGISQSGSGAHRQRSAKHSQPAYAGFVQDDWRILPKVTINLGLRYEIIPPIKEQNNLLGNFTPSQGLIQAGIQTNTLYKIDANNFAPRLGVAWDVTGSGKTVVRAAVGMFYVTEEEAIYIQPIGHYTAATGLNGDPTGAIRMRQMALSCRAREILPWAGWYSLPRQAIRLLFRQVSIGLGTLFFRACRVRSSVEMGSGQTLSPVL